MSLEKTLNLGIAWYIQNYPDFVHKRDFRPGTLGRFLSCSLSIRFYLDRTVDYIKHSDWDNNFITNYTPSLMKESKHLGHFKDIDMGIRFYLFHSFYHQLETTLRIIHEELNLPRGKPIEKINVLVKCFPKDFIDCIDALRNTIHNNGYYRPLDKQPKRIVYKTEILNIEFDASKKVDIGTDETLFIIKDMLEYTESLLKSTPVQNIPFTRDRN